MYCTILINKKDLSITVTSDCLIEAAPICETSSAGSIDRFRVPSVVEIVYPHANKIVQVPNMEKF